MNIYSAIRQAADYIETHPDAYNFKEVRVPDCGTRGCMLGWIGFFAGVPVGSDVLTKVGHALLKETGDVHCDLSFYDKIQDSGGKGYGNCAAAAVIGMRAYAEKYHAPANPQRPDSALVADLLARLVGPTVSTEAKSEELTW